MSKFKIKIATLLLLFGFSFGTLTDVTANLMPETTTTAQASSKVSKSQARKIAAINKKLSKKQKAAKKWIAKRESGYNYSARNGRCYGTWTKAKRFWQSHHWY